MIPKRYLLVFGTFLLSVLLYVDRICISAAKEPITEDLGLTDEQFGWALSAFALGYALCQAPSGWLADRFGPRCVLSAVVTFWSIFTGLTGAAWSYVSLLVTRLLFGAGEAGVFPKSITAVTDQETRLWSCLRGDEGVQIVTEGFRSGFGIRTRWLFHASQPWIDVTYELADGWSAAPQAVRFCFPTNVAGAIYRYDTAGAVLKAGPDAGAYEFGGPQVPGAPRYYNNPGHPAHGAWIPGNTLPREFIEGQPWERQWAAK